jgi:CheY-like chemotaxis protein
MGDGMRRSILIVEDHEDTLMALETILVCSKFTCKGVMSRDEAQNVLSAGYEPACVIMDYYMPGMGLGEFLDQTAQLNLQVVLTTAAKDASEVAQRFGIKHVLAKPIDGEKLIGLITQIMGSPVNY